MGPTHCPLPPELEFLIIDCLSTDKQSLVSCSLVCSRWLLASRRHLFRDITIKPSVQLNPNPFADFLHTLELSGGDNVEQAIGPCIMKITFDGSAWHRRSVLTCPLNLLCALMSKLPHLTSLYIKDMVVSDDPVPGNFPAETDGTIRFELEELIVNQCSVRSHDHPRHLLALLSRFSTILSLTVDRWWMWAQDIAPPFSIDDFSAPAVHSLTLRWIRPVCARAIYAFLAGSTSAADGSLTRMSFTGGSSRDFSVLSDFARVLGPTIQHLELRVLPDLPGPLDIFTELSLSTCIALRSLVLDIHPLFDDSPSSGQWHAEDTRDTLTVATRLFQDHRGVFSVLTTLRLEMRPEGLEMLDAFVRVAGDTFPEWPTKLTRTVPADEAEQNRQVWTALEDALCAFPALELVELVLYERPEHNEILTDEAKAALRTALEGRLPRLWPSGVMQLVFEAYVHRPS